VAWAKHQGRQVSDYTMPSTLLALLASKGHE